MSLPTLKPGAVVRGSLFPEPVQVILCTTIGTSVRIVGKGLESGKVYEPVLEKEQLVSLEVSPDQPPYDGNPRHFPAGNRGDATCTRIRI